MKTAAFIVAALLIVFPPLGFGVLAAWAIGWGLDKLVNTPPSIRY